MRTASSLIRNVNRGGEIVRCAWETRQWPTVTAAYLGLRTLRYPFSLRVRELQPLTVREVSDIWTFWQIFARQVYPLSRSEKVIVDAGANIGFFTLLAARQARNSQVIAIEPSPESYRRLTENVRNNGFRERISCLNCALSGYEEVRLMQVGQSRSQLQRLLPRNSVASIGTAVKTVTLERVLDGIPVVDLLKMDIEGGEYEVLFGSPPQTLQKIKTLILEYHPDEGSPGDLLSFLQGRGFKLQHDVHNVKGYGVAKLERSN